ncbi:MAG: N-acetyl sugar amidotransferase [Bacteroidota bacterium]
MLIKDSPISDNSTSISRPGYQVCTNCVLDTSEPTISFDEQGVCNFCRQYKTKDEQTSMSKEQKQQKLQAAINTIKQKGAGKQYDCIIGLSGGVDSSYVAWLVKHHGLRPLAVHFDNGWNAELAVHNIEHICKKLDIDLYTHVVDWEEFRDLQLAFLKSGVANAEIPTDHGIFAILYHLARKYHVKYIIDGVNDATESNISLTIGGWNYADLVQLNAIYKRFGTGKLKTYPRMGLLQKFINRKILKINQFSILNYIDYNKAAVKQFLQKELGWRDYGGKHFESTFTKWHQAVYLPQRFGFDKRRLHLSDLILAGQITRDEAIEELKNPALSAAAIAELEEYVQKKLGFTASEYSQLKAAAPKTYKDYPNSEKWMKLYKKFSAGG